MNKLEKTIKKFKDNGFRFFGDETGKSVSIGLFIALAYHKYGFREDYYKVFSDMDKEYAALQLETLDGFSYIFRFSKS